MKTTIEQRFGALMRFVVDRGKKGLQAKISKEVGIQTSNLSEIIHKDKGTHEDIRRRVYEAACSLSGVFQNIPYHAALSFGQLLLDGVPGEEALERINAVPKATISLGKGTFLGPKGNFFLGDSSKENYIDFISVPKAKARLSAGAGTFAEEGFAGEYHFRSDWLNAICSPSAAILFECTGESMWPTIGDRETVLVDRSDTDLKDGKIFALGVGDAVLIKRLHLTIDNLIQVISDNPDKSRFPTDTIEPESIRILGRVRWRAGEL